MSSLVSLLPRKIEVSANLKALVRPNLQQPRVCAERFRIPKWSTRPYILIYRQLVAFFSILFTGPIFQRMRKAT